jgi:hypothetical protein
MKTIPIDEIKVDMVSVESSNVAYIGYNTEAVILAIQMINGSLYYYLDVPIVVYEELLKSKIIGSYLCRNIKGKYRYVRIN